MNFLKLVFDDVTEHKNCICIEKGRALSHVAIGVNAKMKGSWRSVAVFAKFSLSAAAMALAQAVGLHFSPPRPHPTFPLLRSFATPVLYCVASCAHYCYYCIHPPPLCLAQQCTHQLCPFEPSIFHHISGCETYRKYDTLPVLKVARSI